MILPLDDRVIVIVVVVVFVLGGGGTGAGTKQYGTHTLACSSHVCLPNINNPRYLYFSFPTWYTTIYF